MNLKLVLAGVAGGVVMFLWGFVSHMLLPLGDAGISSLPYQADLLPPMSAKLTKPGLYMFPWPESSPGTPMPQTAEAMETANEMHKTSPHGMLLYHPPTGPFVMTGHLVIEFGTNVASSLVAAVLVCMTLGSLDSFAKRMLFVTAIGLSAGIAVNMPYWNWYEFPATFTLAEMVSHIIGFALVGAAIGAILKPAAATATSQPAA